MLIMPYIYRKVSGYQHPFSALNTTREEIINCKKLDLYRCIITVGNPSFLTLKDIRFYGFARAMYNSILKKVAIVAVNIQSDLSGIRRHPIFDSYVSDDKRIVSYNLGMAFAKLYSEKLLNIPNLVHLEFLKKQNAVTFVSQQSKSRTREPDLVGQTSDGKWHIFEAKGVSSSASQLSGKIIEAKKQIREVAAVHGSPPTTGSACATYIGRDRILTYLSDPPSEGNKQIEFPREKFLKSYYAPFLLAKETLDAPSRKEKINGFEVVFYDFKNASRKLSIGLDSEVADLIQSNNFNLSLVNLERRLKDYSTKVQGDGRYSIGLDGFVVGYTDY